MKSTVLGFQKLTVHIGLGQDLNPEHRERILILWRRKTIEWELDAKSVKSR
jgi:hypothetical protein